MYYALFNNNQIKIYITCFFPNIEMRIQPEISLILMRNSSNLVWADFQGFSCHMEGEGIETGENKKAPGGRVKEYILGLYFLS